MIEKTKWVRGAVLPIAVLALLELAMAMREEPSFSLAAPSQILLAWYLALMDGSLLTATGETLWTTVCGTVIGGCIGLLFGIVLGLSNWIDRVLSIPLELSRPLPPIALIPVLILLVGFGPRLEIIVVSFSAVWPMLVLTRSAVRGISKKLLDVATVLNLSSWRVATQIVLPSIVPMTVNSLRVTFATALIVAVTAEIAGNPFGLGAALMSAQQTLQPAPMLAYLIWIGVVGWVLNLVTLQLQRLPMAKVRAR